MCGIAGIVSVNGKPLGSPDVIKRMCDIQAHRGPDDAGYVFFRSSTRASTGEGGYWREFVEEEFRHKNEHLPAYGGSYFQAQFANNDFSVALGHRRLSIIDLTSAGHQPMPSPNRRYWVTYNGMIYNFPELRAELISKGHVFQTHTDTEILIHLWEEYGKDSLLMLNGMFAYAIYDRVKNEITLTRDRFGVKPLYYCFTRDYLLFASEAKAILKSGIIKPEFHPETLVEYFTFQNTLSRQTIYDGISLLQPGEYLTFNPRSDQRSKPQRYHKSFPAVDPSFQQRNDTKERVADAFATAVKRQLLSDVEVGSYLSGGMDSGSIVAVSGQSIPRLLTFTGGFDLTNVNGIEQGFDERELAEKLSYLLQTEHYAVVLHAGDMPAAMDKISWHVDDPRVGMCHQNWYVAKLASKFVKVCLAGAGGDELFGGYPWRYMCAIHANDFSECDHLNFNYWHRFLTPEKLPKLFSQDLSEHIDHPYTSFLEIMADAPPWQDELSRVDNIIQRLLYFEFKTFMHGFLLIEDHISMAHGLETRVPFLDNDLVDLAWSIPPSMKMDTQKLTANTNNGYIESTEGKMILRQAMEKYLPKEFTRQHKQGFSSPDENWYRGPSMDYIKSILFDKKTLERPWFNQEFVHEKLNDHFEGRQNNRLLIWSLLSIEWQHRHFLD